MNVIEYYKNKPIIQRINEQKKLLEEYDRYYKLEIITEDEYIKAINQVNIAIEEIEESLSE